MTVSMHNCLMLLQGRCLWREFPPFLDQKFTQQEGLLAQSFGILIMWKKIDQLITENGNTTRFQANDGNACTNWLTERNEYLVQHMVRQIEHAIIVERTPTTNR